MTARAVVDALAALHLVMDGKNAGPIADRLEETHLVTAPDLFTCEVANGLLDVRRAQALTARITHWIILQYSVLGAIAAVLLDFMKQPAPFVETGMRVWAVVIALEIFVGAYYYTLFEIMSSREYIATKLTKMVRETFPGAKELGAALLERLGSIAFSMR